MEAPFLVAAMSTPDYAPRASRLASSCKSVGVPYVIYEVPSVHRSISERGTADPAYTKSNFVHFLLEEYRRPILYVDADCVFVSYPGLLNRIAGHVDFAAYNWFADEHNDGFAPVEMQMPSGEINSNRFYRFSDAIDFYDPSQLTCSGAVQLYGDTAAARQLLARWFDAIARFPDSADDPCLDFAFNNFSRDIGLSSFWLPKAYARYRWWIYVKPVINHPDRTSSGNGFKEIPEAGGLKRYYLERAARRQSPPPFPRDCIIDVEDRILLKPVGEQLKFAGATDFSFWVD